MNCKPGDLALVVASRTKAGSLNIGKVVRVISPITGPVSGAACWVTEPTLFDAAGVLSVIADKHLRPIRDSGDDAQDESLSWLPVPQKEIA